MLADETAALLASVKRKGVYLVNHECQIFL